ncbi:MAG: hypothetical protein BWK73_53900 [Thiothrix lacustris]|uniref:Uncharacterized protein n=1 Tax=Thiothrix lacustris TaxID=525917 RepID=A0A1Y1Q6T8_9GAMM|nr:MAG: hypothetical protein BWK73_53900 [Thiothrix lacustris]
MKYRSTTLCLLVLLTLWQAAAHAAPDDTCNGQSFSKTFASGAKWRLCWANQPAEGIVLSQIRYQAPHQPERRVLGQASLSQLETAFDDGSVTPLFLSTEAGFGGNNLQTLTAQDCATGTLHAADGRNVLCETTRDSAAIPTNTSRNAKGNYWNSPATRKSAHAITAYAGVFTKTARLNPASV